MPIYEIEGPDKRIYEIEGPENASEQDLFTAARGFMQQEQKRERSAKIDTEVAEAEKAAEAARKAALAPTPEGGFKAAARAGFERLQGDIAGVAGRTGLMDVGTAETFKAEKEKRAGEIFQGTEDGWLESPWTKFKETLGGSAAAMAAPLIVGGIAATAPVAGALGLGTAAAGLGAAGLVSLAQFTGSNLSRQMQEKGVGLADTDLLSAGAAAVPQAALDLVSFKMLPGINKIFQSVGKELTESQLKAIAQRNLLTNVGMSGGKIAGVEGLTEVGQQFLERLQADISTLDKEARDEYVESFIGGAVLGGTFGGVAGVGARGRAQRKLEGIEAGRAAEEEARAAVEQAAQTPVTPEGTAPTPEGTAPTPEQTLAQKQRAGLEALGESTEFPSEISPTGAQTREQRQLAAQAGIDAAQTVAPRAPVQGDLFLDAAQRARAEGAPISEQQRLMDVGAVPTPAAAPAPAPVQNLFDAQGNKLPPGSALQAYDAYGASVTPPAAIPAGQGALPLVGGRTQEQQIIEMYAADQNAQAVTNARAKQAERVAQGEAGAAAAQQERLKFESDLAAADAALQQTRERTTEDNRLGLLLPLVADTNVANVPKAFGRALQTAGFTDTQFTPRERELIQRAYDVRVAEDMRTPEDNPEARRYGTPNQMDVYKPARVQEPQQIGLPGFARPKGMAATTAPAPEPEVAETPRDTTIGQEQVDYLFLPAASAVRKNILGKDITDPEQRQYVADQLKAARAAFVQKTDPRSRTAAKRIQNILIQPPFAQQGEMFGPRGGILPQPKAPKQEVKDVDKRTTAESTAKPGASKPSVGVGSVGVDAGTAGEVDTGGVSGTGQRGLAGTGKGAKPDARGTKVAPVTVEEKKEKEAKKATATTPVEEKETVPTMQEMQDAGFSSYEIENLKKDYWPERYRQIKQGYKYIAGEFRQVTQADVDTVKKGNKQRQVLKAEAKEKMDKAFAEDPNAGVSNIVGSDWGMGANANQTTEQYQKSAYAALDRKYGFADSNVAILESRLAAAKKATAPTTTPTADKTIAESEEREAKRVKAEAKKPSPPVVKPEVKAASAFDTMVAQMASGPTIASTGKAEPVAEKQKIINAFDLPLNRPPTGIGKEAGEKDALNRALSRTKGKKLSLEEAIGEDLPSDVQGALKDGNLSDALDTLAANTSGVVNRILRALSRVAGDTKVKVVDNLKDASGKPVPGMFDPETNTIMLDSKTGLNNHTLVHETTHSALSHVLDNAAHPVTKQLTNLFNSVKPLLDTAYGATSVQEFVAEAWGNPEFRAKLNGMNPDGTNISALQKFVNTVANFMRRMVGMDSKSITSAFDAADQLMSAIISPAPESRIGEALYMASANGTGAKLLGGTVDKIINSIPYTSESRKNQIHEGTVNGIPKVIRAATLNILPLNAFADAADVNNTLPQVRKLNEVVREHDGRLSKRIQSIDAINDNSIKWWNTQSEANRTEFNYIVNTASRESLDMFDPKGREAYKNDPEQQQAYDELKPRFDKLFANAQARTVYKDILKSYKDLRDAAVKNMSTLVGESIENKERATNARGIIQRLLDQMGTIKGYVPFERRGEYRLSYETDTASGPIIRHFESERAREAAIKDALANGADPKTIQRFSKIADFNYKNAPSGSFMNQIVSTMEVNGVPSEVMDKVIAQWIDIMPETSFAQGFRKRKGTLGFNENVIDVFSRKPYAFARQLTNMETTSKVRGLMAEAREHVNATGTTDAGRQYLREFDERAKFVMNPEVAEWSKVLTTATFGMTLGANISSSIVNATSIPIVIGPYLAGSYGPAAATKAIGTATKIFMGSGSVHTIEGKKLKGGKSIENYDFDDPKLPASIRRYKTLAERSAFKGQLGRSLTQDVLDIEDGKGGIRSKVNKYMGYFMHHGERMNRQITLISAYDLELNRLNASKKDSERNLSQEDKELQAADKAIETAELLNGGISAMAAPRIAQNSIGRVALMYKRYGVSMYYMMFKTAKDATMNADPEVRKQAWKQLGWVSGSATLMAGVRGAPLYGAVRVLFEMFRDDDDDSFDTVMRKFVGDTAFGGLFNAATGLEIGSRVSMTDMIFRPSQSTDANQSALDLAMEFVGGPVYGTAKRMVRGSEMINEGNFARGVEQMLPSAIANPLKAVRYGVEGPNTLRGDPITSEISPWNVAAQAFGFAPAEYTRQLEVNANEKKISRYQTTYRTKLMNEFYMAVKQGDSDGIAEVTQQIAKWNAKHPYPGIAVTPDSIRSSMQRHMKEAAMMRSGINISKARMPQFLQSMQEYE